MPQLGRLLVCLAVLIICALGDRLSSFTNFGAAVLVGDREVFAGEPANYARPGTVYVYRKGASLQDSWREVATLTAPGATVGDRSGHRSRWRRDGSSSAPGRTRSTSSRSATRHGRSPPRCRRRVCPATASASAARWRRRAEYLFVGREAVNLSGRGRGGVFPDAGCRRGRETAGDAVGRGVCVPPGCDRRLHARRDAHRVGRVTRPVTTSGTRSPRPAGRCSSAPAVTRPAPGSSTSSVSERMARGRSSGTSRRCPRRRTISSARRCRSSATPRWCRRRAIKAGTAPCTSFAAWRRAHGRVALRAARRRPGQAPAGNFTWRELTRLSAPVSTRADRFGSTVAADEREIWVGAPGGVGQVYVFAGNARRGSRRAAEDRRSELGRSRRHWRRGVLAGRHRGGGRDRIQQPVGRRADLRTRFVRRVEGTSDSHDAARRDSALHRHRTPLQWRRQGRDLRLRRDESPGVPAAVEAQRRRDSSPR